MRELVKASNELLRQRSKPVKKINSTIKALARDLVEFMNTPRPGSLIPLGLAAPELGELIRMIAFRGNPASINEDDIQVLINPTMVYAKGFQLVRESCLNIPGKVFTVRRAKTVKIHGLTLEGVERSFRGRDLLAQIFQHELNHLDGILIDKIGKRRK